MPAVKKMFERLSHCQCASAHVMIRVASFVDLTGTDSVRSASPLRHAMPLLRTTTRPKKASGMLTPEHSSVISCSLAGFLAGVHLAQFSGILELPSFASTFPGLTAISKSRLSASLLGGAVVGTPFAGPLCDARGRGAALAFSGALFLISATVISHAHSTNELAAGRVLAGIAYALGNVAAPAYLAETAPNAMRALYVNIYQLSITAGILASQLVNVAGATGLPWRTITLLSTMPAAMLMTLSGCRFAEPVAWIVRKGDDVKNESFKELRRDRSSGKRLRVAVGIMVSQQLTGVNGVIFYAPAMVMSLGLGAQGDTAPFWAAVAVGAANCAASAVAMVGVERAGRRVLLLGGAGAIGIALIVLGAVKWNGGPALVGVAALVGFIIAFAGSFGPLPFLVAAEVLPMQYRGAGLTIVGVVAHSTSFFVVVAFLALEKGIGTAVYFVFAALVVLCAGFVYVCVPETRGLTLHDIDALFGQKTGRKLESRQSV